MKQAKPLSLFGIDCRHWPEDILMLEKLLTYIAPTGILEIGTRSGPLSLYFAMYGKINYVSVVTVDISHKRLLRNTRDLLRQLDCSFLKQDCFDLQLASVLACEPPRLVYCDGGDKERELEYFSSQLHTTDCIAVHDWITGVDATKFDSDWEASRGLQPILEPELTRIDAHFRAWERVGADWVKTGA